MAKKKKDEISLENKAPTLTKGDREEDKFWEQLIAKLVCRDMMRQEEIKEFNGLCLSPEQHARLEEHSYEKWVEELEEYGIGRLIVSSRFWPDAYMLPPGIGITPRKAFPSLDEQYRKLKIPRKRFGGR